jgi:hypothetical protein
MKQHCQRVTEISTACTEPRGAVDFISLSMLSSLQRSGLFFSPNFMLSAPFKTRTKELLPLGKIRAKRSRLKEIPCFRTRLAKLSYSRHRLQKNGLLPLWVSPRKFTSAKGLPGMDQMKSGPIPLLSTHLAFRANLCVSLEEYLSLGPRSPLSLSVVTASKNRADNCAGIEMRFMKEPCNEQHRVCSVTMVTTNQACATTKNYPRQPEKPFSYRRG